MASASAGWNTIESDAGVFTYLIEKLGVKGVQFEELISLDPESIKALSPVYGVIFLFSVSQTSPPARSATTPIDGHYDSAAAESLFFAAQVIQNACGTQALLSVLLNKLHGELGPALRSFRDFTLPLPPAFRGEALSNSEAIRDAHNAFARSSPFVDETQRPPDAETEDAFHFIAYAAAAGQLYELDGLQPAPISHGPCADAEFADRVIPVLQRRIARYPASEIRFNLLACCGDLRERARALGDTAGLEHEEAKRRAWVWENALRRHNFLGFAVEVLKGVVGSKMEQGGEEAYRQWVDEAVGRTRDKRAAVLAKREKAGAGDGEGGMDVDI